MKIPKVVLMCLVCCAVAALGADGYQVTKKIPVAGQLCHSSGKSKYPQWVSSHNFFKRTTVLDINAGLSISNGPCYRALRRRVAK